MSKAAKEETAVDPEKPAAEETATAPTPTVGRIVHYRPIADEFKNNEADLAPAIVVRVWGPDTVNLRIFTDGGEVIWKTSVVQGDGAGQWSWPPRG